MSPEWRSKCWLFCSRADSNLSVHSPPLSLNPILVGANSAQQNSQKPCTKSSSLRRQYFERSSKWPGQEVISFRLLLVNPTAPSKNWTRAWWPSKRAPGREWVGVGVGNVMSNSVIRPLRAGFAGCQKTTIHWGQLTNSSQKKFTEGQNHMHCYSLVPICLYMLQNTFTFYLQSATLPVIHPQRGHDDHHHPCQFPFSWWKNNIEYFTNQVYIKENRQKPAGRHSCHKLDWEGLLYI